MKRIAWIAFILLLVGGSLDTYAQNKVVVIPLMEEVATQKYFFASGVILKTGVKNHVFGKPFTVTKETSGPGIYTFILEAYNVGCEPPLVPVFLATATEPGIVSYDPEALIDCSTGNATFTINTWSTSGTAADRGFSFLITRKDVD